MKRLSLVVLLVTSLSIVTAAASASEDYFATGSGRDGAVTLNAATVVNAYATVTSATVAAGSTSIDVDSSAGIAAGDLVLVAQMNAVTGLSSGVHTAGVDLTATPAGRFEYARVESVTAASLTLTFPLLRAYDGSHTQVVRVPEYTDVTIGAAGEVRAQPWNGREGGIVAFFASGLVTNEGVVSASAAGFRGGVSFKSAPATDGCSDPSQPAPDGQPRGEGIDGPLWGTTGKANAVNGGGGGICHNSGGGGGGNGGRGGTGGRTWDGDGARDQGGRGGDNLLFSALTRVSFGGGGGAGHGNNGVSTDGGHGGGLVMVRAGAIAGNGLFVAHGASAANAGNDGAGGGGAGGLVVLRAVGSIDCLGARANGGDGGNATAASHGPGGGGAGGRILVQSAGGTCLAQATHGLAGTQPDQNAVDGLSYGATPTGTSTSAAGVVEAPPAGGLLLDTDGDGLYDLFEGAGDADGDGLADFRDADDDGDGIPTADEFADPNGDHDPQDAIDSDADGVPDYLDPDPVPVAAVSIGAPADGSLVNDDTPTISGSATPGQTVTLVIDGAAPVTVTADPLTGDWTYDPAMSLTEGSHTVEATVALGNQSETDSATFTIDATAPVVLIDVPTPTQDTTPTFTGTVDDPNATVTLVIDGGTPIVVTVAADGSFTYTPPTDLGFGPHLVQVFASDPAGNVGEAQVAFEIDADECADQTAMCDPNATCTNTVGSYLCTCNAGYSGDGMTCTDVDECASGAATCDANAICTNTAGGFDCTCASGFAGDGTTCTDIDECAAGTASCDANAICTNDEGGFTCACAPGFSGDGTICTDVDECSEQIAGCDADATCTNTPGGFECACEPGYTGDGTTCADIDECAGGTSDCDTNATCTNNAGGFTCACDAGFVGDGVQCEPMDCACSDEEVCVGGTCFEQCDDDADCTLPDLCYDGRCSSDPCASIVCPDTEVCAGGTCFETCVDSVDCSNPDALCYDGRCTNDVCAGIACGSSQTCWGGSCFDTCGTDVDCTNPSERCYESRCTDDACSGVTCPQGSVCWGGSCFDACGEDVDCTNPSERCYEGRCTDEACRDVQCATTQVCWGGSCFDACGDSVDCSDPSDSCYETRCATDPCEGVQCPSEQMCVQGYCRTGCDTDEECGAGESCVLGLCGSETTEPPISGPGTGVPEDGCGCASAQSNAGNAALALLALLSLTLVRIRRRGPRS